MVVSQIPAFTWRAGSERFEPSGEALPPEPVDEYVAAVKPDLSELKERARRAFLLKEAPSDPLQRSVAFDGPVEGPGKHLAFLEGLYRHPRREGTAERDTILALVDAATQGEGPVPEVVLRPAVHLVETLLDRAQSHFKPAWGRAKEEPDEGRALAAELAGRVESWWSQGRIRVERDGRPVFPGAVDLLEELARRPAVRGSTIELEAPRATDFSQTATEIYERLYTSGTSGPHEAMKRLQGEPSEVLDEVVAMSCYDRDEAGLEKLTKVLETAATDERLRANLEKHRPAFLGLADRMLATGSIAYLDPQGWRLFSFYDRLLKAFPDQSPAEVLEQAVEPLMERHPELATSLAARLWRQDPELLRPGLELIKARHTEEFDLKESVLKELRQALDSGAWEPDAGDLGWMAGRLYQPAQYGKIEMFGHFRGQEVALWLNTLQPHADQLRELELPAPDGRIVPFGQALLEQLILDDDAEPKDLKAPVVLQLLNLALPQAASWLLERAGQLLAGAASLDALDEPAQKAVSLALTLPEAAPLAEKHLLETPRNRLLDERLDGFRADYVKRGDVDALRRLAVAQRGTDRDLVLQRTALVLAEAPAADPELIKRELATAAGLSDEGYAHLRALPPAQAMELVSDRLPRLAEGPRALGEHMLEGELSSLLFEKLLGGPLDLDRVDRALQLTYDRGNLERLRTAWLDGVDAHSLKHLMHKVEDPYDAFRVLKHLRQTCPEGLALDDAAWLFAESMADDGLSKAAERYQAALGQLASGTTIEELKRRSVALSSDDAATSTIELDLDDQVLWVGSVGVEVG